MAAQSDPAVKCPGIAGLIQGKESYDLDNFYEDYKDIFATIKTCSIASSKDRMLQPFDSGFFEGRDNFIVDFGGHLTLPSKPQLADFIIKHCDLH